MNKIKSLLKILGVKKVYKLLHNSVAVLKKNRVCCNICGWIDEEFVGDEWHPSTICQYCNSQVRHRLFWAIIEKNIPPITKDILSGNTLHFAPERIMRNKIKSLSQVYHTADFFAKNYDYPEIDFNLDITNMSKIEHESYDCVIAFDTLEHVSSYKNALLELYRITKPGGFCILTVPQRDHLEFTLEDPNIKSPKQRLEAYGQWDHLRIFGNDFPRFIAEAGFVVTVLDENIFNEKQIKYNVLFPPKPSSDINATNHRKVFFGQKPKEQV